MDSTLDLNSSYASIILSHGAVVHDTIPVINGGSAASATLCYTSQGLFERVQDKSVRLFPSPVSEELTVSSERALINRIIVRDLTGRTCKDVAISPAQTAHLDMSGVRSGVYVLTVTMSTGEFTIPAAVAR